MRERDSSLSDYLAVLARRRWSVLCAVVLVPLVALGFSLRQQELFQAEAEVLLSRQNIANALTGTADPLSYQQADRLVETQARLAGTPEVVERVLDVVAASGLTSRELLETSEVRPQANADLLVFSVRHPDPALARRLATEYARQFTVYRRELDTASIVHAREGVSRRLGTLRADGQSGTALYENLVEKEEQLRTLEALQTSNASLTREGDTAEQVQPKLLQNLIIGLFLGLILGVGTAFFREALDTRVRSDDEITEPLGLPLLARIPSPPLHLSSANKLVMLSEPQSHDAEAFRILRTNLDFVRLARDVKSIMVTSALEQEGKSTTVANLAVALATAGQRVALLDLDLRRPYVGRFFNLEDRSGITNMVLGQVSLAEALGSLRPDGETAGAPSTEANGNSNGHHRGRLFVLPSGPIPPDPGEFVGHPRLDEIIRAVGELVDVVLIDAPPLLPVGDALVIGAKVDGVVAVTKLNAVNRSVLSELSDRLERIPAPKLGLVMTGAEKSESYYGRAYAYEPRMVHEVAS